LLSLNARWLTWVTLTSRLRHQTTSPTTSTKHWGIYFWMLPKQVNQF